MSLYTLLSHSHPGTTVRPRRLPFPDGPVGSSPRRVPPAEIGILLGVLPDHLFVQLDPQSRSGQELDGSVLDVEDFWVLQVGQEIKVAGVVVHLT